MNTLTVHKHVARYSQAEEAFHVASHMMGVLLGFAALYLTIQHYHSGIGLISGIVFSLSLLILYSASCLYHSIPGVHPKLKRVLQVIDHCSIFILIAGTGTPFILCAMSSFSVPAAAFYNLLMWGCAAVGIVLLSIDLQKFKRLSIVLYLVMGFSVLAQNAGLQAALGPTGYALLLGGGVVYCVGLVFYSIKIRWTHAVFHVLCYVASVMHCICIIRFVI